jgi:hypothetical protein
MGCTNPGHSMTTVCEAAAASAGVCIYNTMLYLYIYCEYVYVCISEKSVFVRATKSALQLHNALYNITQNVLNIHKFLKMNCSQPQGSNRGKTWMRVDQHVFLYYLANLWWLHPDIAPTCTPLAKALHKSLTPGRPGD